MVGSACVNITANFSTWGDCILEAVFFDSMAFMTIGIILTIAYFSFKFRLPQEVSMTMAAAIAFIMTYFNPSPEMLALDVIIILLIAIMAIFGVLRTGGR